MSEEHGTHDRAVWFDIPVADLDRAMAFYREVLACGIQKESVGGVDFAVLEHGAGVGGCLVVKPEEIAGDGGPLLYLNVDGRIRGAEAKVTELGGEVLESTHMIGPHGHRAIVLDSEGNRVALHSESDA